MLVFRMNDAAASGLRILDGSGFTPPPDGIAAGLRAMIAKGIELRGEVVVWRDSAEWAAPPPQRVTDLTGWECSVNSFHLEDEVPVAVVLSDEGAPSITDQDQVVLLRHGVAFGLETCRLAVGLARPVPVRCIVSTNETNGTFRFHRIRPGEDWIIEDLNAYKLDKVAIIDLVPS